jgi:hypothetical protein
VILACFKSFLINNLELALPLHSKLSVPERDNMLRIERSSNGNVIFTLSGRIETEGVDELQRLFGLETVDLHIVLDLRDVTLVDRDAVKF